MEENLLGGWSPLEAVSAAFLGLLPLLVHGSKAMPSIGEFCKIKWRLTLYQLQFHSFKLSDCVVSKLCLLNRGCPRSRSCGVLTLANLTHLLDVPAVQGSSFLVFHGRAFVEVLGQMGLVEARGLHHLPLWKVVLLHVAFHYLSHTPRVVPKTRGRVCKTHLADDDQWKSKKIIHGDYVLLLCCSFVFCNICFCNIVNRLYIDVFISLLLEWLDLKIVSIYTPI